MIKQMNHTPMNSYHIFRSHFGNKVVFILVSDDIEWCKEALSKRNRIEDLYFASDPSFANEDGYVFFKMFL